MLQRIAYILQHKCLISPKLPILVGFSGGPDSLCLVDVLSRAGYDVIALHLNHNLRPEAQQEVKDLARLYQNAPWRLIQEELDVKNFAREKGIGLEEAGRTLRYQALFRLAEKLNAQAVAVGHNLDDQVETILMHLLRGSGMEGLIGMAFRTRPNTWSRAIPLVRPLLETGRDDVLAYLERYGLKPLWDTSNQSLLFERNRIRLELLPDLELYNPNIRQALSRMAGILRAEHTHLQTLTEEAWQECIDAQGDGYVAVNLGNFLTRPLAIQRRLVRKMVAWTLDEQPSLAYADYERLRRTIADARAGRKIDIAAGLYLMAEGSWAWLATKEARLPAGFWPQLPIPEAMVLAVPGEVQLADEWVLESRLISLEQAEEMLEKVRYDAFQCLLGSTERVEDLRIRQRRPGDCFTPLGMEGKWVRVGDFLAKQKLPKRARQRWPLVCWGDEIVWIPGLRINHHWRITPQNKWVISLRCERRE